MGDLAHVAEQLIDAFTVDESLSHAVGQAGKKAAFEEVERDAGSDRKMSGKPVKLGAGYDVEPDGAMLNLRPAGLWLLLADGRKRSGTIRPKRRGNKRAVLTPQGPRSSSRYRPSRGKGTLDRLEARLPNDVERALTETLTTRLKGL